MVLSVPCRSLIRRHAAYFYVGLMSRSMAMNRLSKPWLASSHVPSPLPGVGGFQLAVLLLQVSSRQDLGGAAKR